MKEIARKALLFDFYGELLTEHQKKVYEDAVMNDYSLSELAEEYGAGEMAAQLGRAVAGFTGCDLEDRIQIDFSATGDLRYYNGIAFKGFISGIPGSVLSGGQYDKLMRKMGRKDRAIGFAVFLDMLERLTEEETTRA